MSHQNGQAFNYLKKKKSTTQAGGSGQSSGGGSRVFTRQLPDDTMHHPPGAMLAIGFLGILLGLAANGWQLLTTYTAFWDMFNPNGKPINQGDYVARSTMIAIMGRMATYTGQVITWDMALNSKEDLSPPRYEFGPLPVPPVARPGFTKFV